MRWEVRDIHQEVATVDGERAVDEGGVLLPVDFEGSLRYDGVGGGVEGDPKGSVRTQLVRIRCGEQEEEKGGGTNTVCIGSLEGPAWSCVVEVIMQR